MAKGMHQTKKQCERRNNISVAKAKANEENISGEKQRKKSKEKNNGISENGSEASSVSGSENKSGRRHQYRASAS